MTSTDIMIPGEGGASPEAGELVPTNPYTALRFVFGMLLGVEDLETEQAYHRGKSRLHNAWCHRDGVLHGFGVGFNDRRELQVEPGLALDGAGRELHLDGPICLNLGRWFEAHREDAGFDPTDVEDGGKRFDAHVVVRFRACLARQVPAIADPCAGAETTTAYSRVVEMVETILRPGLSTAGPKPYHRLRVLFGLEAPTVADGAVVARIGDILAMGPADQPRAYLEAFRDYAALDQIELRPAVDEEGETSSIFPEDETAEVVLADLHDVIVREGQDGWTLSDPLPELDVTVRPSHVATATIQELLCGPLFAGPGAAPPMPSGPSEPSEPSEEEEGGGGGDEEGGPSAPALAPEGTGTGGPRVDPDTVELGPRRITFRSEGPIHPASVRVAAFVVTAFDPETGWSRVDLRRTRLSAGGDVVTVELKEDPAGNLVRIIAFGTGPNPLLGTNLVPLAGAKDGPPGSIHNGRDFVHMVRRG